MRRDFQPPGFCSLPIRPLTNGWNNRVHFNSKLGTLNRNDLRHPGSIRLARIDPNTFKTTHPAVFCDDTGGRSQKENRNPLFFCFSHLFRGCFHIFAIKQINNGYRGCSQAAGQSGGIDSGITSADYCHLFPHIHGHALIYRLQKLQGRDNAFTGFIRHSQF